jgi:hypothetical protein
MMFLDFNIDLFIGFICFLSVVDVVRFDSSVCNLNHRKTFLENLTDCGSIVCFEGPPSHLVSDHFILYMSIRNLYLKSIHLNNRLFSLHKVSLSEERLLRMAPRFLVVTFVYCTVDSSFSLRQILALAIKLKSLSITRTRHNFFQVFSIISTCCPNLTFLDLSDTSVCDYHMKYFLLRTNLVSLRMNGTYVSNELISKLVVNNKQLQILG